MSPVFGLEYCIPRPLAPERPHREIPTREVGRYEPALDHIDVAGSESGHDFAAKWGYSCGRETAAKGEENKTVSGGM
jgi:hypothetical protein